MVIFSIKSKLFTSDRSLEQDFESQSTALSLTWLEAICDKGEGEDEDAVMRIRTKTMATTMMMMRRRKLKIIWSWECLPAHSLSG